MQLLQQQLFASDTYGQFSAFGTFLLDQNNKVHIFQENEQIFEQEFYFPIYSLKFYIKHNVLFLLVGSNELNIIRIERTALICKAAPSLYFDGIQQIEIIGATQQILCRTGDNRIVVFELHDMTAVEVLNFKSVPVELCSVLESQISLIIQINGESNFAVMKMVPQQNKYSLEAFKYFPIRIASNPLKIQLVHVHLQQYLHLFILYENRVVFLKIDKIEENDDSENLVYKQVTIVEGEFNNILSHNNQLICVGQTVSIFTINDDSVIDQVSHDLEGFEAEGVTIDQATNDLLLTGSGGVMRLTENDLM